MYHVLVNPLYEPRVLCPGLTRELRSCAVFRISFKGVRIQNLSTEALWPQKPASACGGPPHNKILWGPKDIEFMRTATRQESGMTNHENPALPTSPTNDACPSEIVPKRSVL